MLGNILKNKKFLLALCLFLFLLLLAYVPNSQHFGYLQDDWNTLHVTEQRGPDFLIEHFSGDRPLRGYFGIVEYWLFGTNLQLYNISALTWRLLDTLFIFLSLMLIWPQKWLANILICSLIIIYPGFHEQPHVLDYQAQFVSRMAFSISLLLGLMAYLSKKKWLSVLLVAIALLSAQVCFGLMEYYIGMEAVRLILFILLFMHLGKKIFTLRNITFMGIFLTNAFIFFFWRLFIFKPLRASVDTGSMLSGYSDLGEKILQSGISLLKNLYRLVVSAFYDPLLVFGKYLNSSEILTYLAITLIGTLIVFFVLLKGVKYFELLSLTDTKRYSLELIVVGIIGSIGALIPIIFGGREITYIILGDRFSFPGSISACILLIGLLSLLKNKRLQLFLFSILIGLSLMTQLVNGDIFKKNYLQTNSTWWQFAWRAPQLKRDTLLSGKIELGMNDEDYTFWSPANLIYYPGEGNLAITAEVLSPETKNKFFTGETESITRKYISYERNFKNILIFTKDMTSCLHVIDGKHPEFSQSAPNYLREVAMLSDISLIDIHSTYSPHPRKDVFGPEPEKGWCYYYELAQLERQRGNWNLVSDYGQTAHEKGLSPSDPMEWIVFIQGFAYTNNPLFDQTLTTAKADPYTDSQLCEVFGSYTSDLDGSAYSVQHLALVNSVCK